MHHRLGRPLPYQLASTTQSAPKAESHLWSGDIIRHYPAFRLAIPVLGARNYALLSLSPLIILLLPARLACLIHAANVHSEPGSNPSIGVCINSTRLTRRTRRATCTSSNEPFEVFVGGRFERSRRNAIVSPGPHASHVLSHVQSWLTKKLEVTYQIVKEQAQYSSLVPGEDKPRNKNLTRQRAHGPLPVESKVILPIGRRLSTA